MKSNKALFPFDRPMAKQHEEIEGLLYGCSKDKFGGMYYTDNANKLHVAVLENDEEIRKRVSAKDVEFHRVKYSWETMNEAQSAVERLFGSYGIHSASFEPENNRICIGVDNANSSVIQDIIAEMAAMGFDDANMFYIAREERPEGFKPLEENVVQSFSMNKPSSIAETTTTTIMPGGMIQVKDSAGTYHHLCSVNYGYVYNSNAYIVGAGHAGSSSYVGKDAYYIPPITGYPISSVPLNYNSANRVKIGVVALYRLGGNYDLHTIRITENNLAFSHTAYNGCSISTIGGNITQGAPLRICGITTRYDADYEYGYCANAQVSLSAYGKTMTNLIQLDFGANNGTSGGPIITQDSDDSIRLVGLASVNGTSTCYAMPVRYMISTYSLSELPEGSITV